MTMLSITVTPEQQDSLLFILTAAERGAAVSWGRANTHQDWAEVSPYPGLLNAVRDAHPVDPGVGGAPVAVHLPPGERVTPGERAAVERLLVIASEHDTGQSRRVADFLLSWWNATDCGGWNPTDLWGVDREIGDDMLTVVHMIRDRMVYPDSLGYTEQFKTLVRLWRPVDPPAWELATEAELVDRPVPGDRVRLMMRGEVQPQVFIVTDLPGRTPDHLVLLNPANGSLFDHQWDPATTYPPTYTPATDVDPPDDLTLTDQNTAPGPQHLGTEAPVPPATTRATLAHPAWSVDDLGDDDLERVPDTPGLPPEDTAVDRHHPVGWRAVDHPLGDRPTPGDRVRIVDRVTPGSRADGLGDMYEVVGLPGRTPDHLVLRNPANGVLFEHYWDPYNTYPPTDTPPETGDPVAEYPMTGADLRDGPGTPPVTPTTVGVSVGF